MKKHLKKSTPKRLALEGGLNPVPVINAAVEVIPPENPGDLASIEAGIRQLQQGLDNRTREYFNKTIYDIVTLGLYFLKAEAIHLLSAQPATVAGGCRKRSKSGQLQAGDGFTAWALDKFPEISERSTRNYRNAARNAGLTADDTMESVIRLREAKMLHDRKPTDLYRLKDKAPAHPAALLTAPNFIWEIMRDLSAHQGAALAARGSMSGEEYEAVQSRTKEFLDAFTGATWGMEGASSVGSHGSTILVIPEGTKPLSKAEQKTAARNAKRRETYKKKQAKKKAGGQ